MKTKYIFSCKKKYIEKTEDLLRRIKIFRARLDNIDNEMAVLEKDGVGATTYDKPTTSQTYKITSATEDDAIKRERRLELSHQRAGLESKLEWIENGLKGLSKQERMILEYFYVEGLHVYEFTYKVFCCERTAKYKKKKAINNVTFALFGTKSLKQRSDGNYSSQKNCTINALQLDKKAI